MLDNQFQDERSLRSQDVLLSTTDGILKFDDFQIASNESAKILDMRESELDKWESSLGFKSLRTVINEANEEFGELESESDLLAWKEKYKDVVELRDSTVTELITDRESQVLSNRSGEYMIGATLVKTYPDKVVKILDGDRDKLVIAASLTESNLEAGIVIETIGNENLPFTNQIAPQFCTGGRRLNSKLEIDKRRVYITYDIKMDCTPTINNFCRTVIWVRVYGQKKNIFGWNKYKTQYNADNIRFALNDNGDLYPMDGAVYSYTSSSDEYEGGMNITLGPGTLYVDQYAMPSNFIGAMGRVRSRGTGNSYAVLCCGSLFPFIDCPSSN